MTDALAAWRSIRASVAWHELIDPDFPAGAHDDVLMRARPELALALHASRASEVLDWSTLSAWQRHIVDDVRFRRTDAFCKGERYGFHPALTVAFDDALSECARGPVLARAARVYLDVAFFHPFSDGNARAALLALDWVLSREGLYVRDVRPVVVDRCADDPAGPEALVRLLRVLVTRSPS